MFTPHRVLLVAQGSEFDWLHTDGVEAAILKEPEQVIKGVRNLEEIRYGCETQRLHSVLDESWMNSPGFWSRMLPR